MRNTGGYGFDNSKLVPFLIVCFERTDFGSILLFAPFPTKFDAVELRSVRNVEDQRNLVLFAIPIDVVSMMDTGVVCKDGETIARTRMKFFDELKSVFGFMCSFFVITVNITSLVTCCSSNSNVRIRKVFALMNYRPTYWCPLSTVDLFRTEDTFVDCDDFETLRMVEDHLCFDVFNHGLLFLSTFQLWLACSDFGDLSCDSSPFVQLSKLASRKVFSKSF